MTAAFRPSKNIFFPFFLQMSWFFKNNFVTPTVIDSIPPLQLYWSPSPPQNFSWLLTTTKYSEKNLHKNPRFVFIKSHVTKILIGVLLRRLSQCSQPSLPKLSLLTQCGNLTVFPSGRFYVKLVSKPIIVEPWNCQNNVFWSFKKARFHAKW